MKNYTHIRDCWKALEYCKTRDEMIEVIATFPHWSGTWSVSPEDEGYVTVTNDWYDANLDDYFVDEDTYCLADALEKEEEIPEENKMKRVVVIVEDGEVQNIYSDEELDIEIIDLDTQDSDDYEERLERLKEVEEDTTLTFMESY